MDHPPNLQFSLHNHLVDHRQVATPKSDHFQIANFKTIFAFFYLVLTTLFAPVLTVSTAERWEAHNHVLKHERYHIGPPGLAKAKSSLKASGGSRPYLQVGA